MGRESIPLQFGQIFAVLLQTLGKLFLHEGVNALLSTPHLSTATPWCNGNTKDFDSFIQGSNPCGVTTLYRVYKTKKDIAACGD